MSPKGFLDILNAKWSNSKHVTSPYTSEGDHTLDLRVYKGNRVILLSGSTHSVLYPESSDANSSSSLDHYACVMLFKC